jgi:hypothetical protein
MGRSDQTPDAQAAARRQLAAKLNVAEDDPMMPYLQANANLEEKVTLWSTAILEMAELAKQQNQAMQQTSQNALKLMGALRSFEPESMQLQQLITQLNSSWERWQSEQDSSKSMLQVLEPMLAQIQQATEKPSETTPGSTRWQYWFWGVVLVQWVTTLLFIASSGQWRGQILENQQLLYTRSVWTIQKLERIEKALGVGPPKEAP